MPNKIIIAAIHGKLTKVRDTLITEGSVNAIKVQFEFRTTDWDNTTKTASFVCGRATPSTPNQDIISVILDENNECNIPHEVLHNKGMFSVGVWGVKDQFRIASNWMYYRIDDGCFAEGSTSLEPTPTVYEQILQSLSDKSDKDHDHDKEYMRIDSLPENLVTKNDLTEQITKMENEFGKEHYTKNEVEKLLADYDTQEEAEKKLTEANKDKISYNYQELTEEQKAQARANIGVTGKADIVQSDWNQNDSTAADYIKNRTHYMAEYPSYSSDVIETPVAGMQLLMDLSSASSSLLKALSYENITSDYMKATYWFALSGQYYLTSTQNWGVLHSVINYWTSRISLMDTKNYVYTVGTSVTMYIILDTSLLSASDKEKFATKGIYLWIKEGDAERYRKLRLSCEKITRLEKYYLPTDVIFSSDLATVATTGDYNDLLNIPDENDALALSVELGLINPATAKDGAIYTDANGAIYSL